MTGNGKPLQPVYGDDWGMVYGIVYGIVFTNIITHY